MKTSWRRLSSSSSEDFFIKMNIFALLIRLQKMSSSRPEDVLIKTNILVLVIRLQTSSRRLPKMFSRHLQKVFKTSSRRLQDVFKTYHQVKLFLLTRLWKAFNTFLRRSFPKTIIYRGICPGNTNSDKFMVSVQNLQER